MDLEAELSGVLDVFPQKSALVCFVPGGADIERDGRHDIGAALRTGIGPFSAGWAFSGETAPFGGKEFFGKKRAFGEMVSPGSILLCGYAGLSLRAGAAGNTV